jgi:hypothetical protein
VHEDNWPPCEPSYQRRELSGELSDEMKFEPAGMTPVEYIKRSKQVLNTLSDLISPNVY